MAMNEMGWLVLAAIAIVLAYDLLRRQIGNAPSHDVDQLTQQLMTMRNQFESHVKTFDQICAQWRQKVLEQDQRLERVMTDARTEIAGAAAAVTDATKKGWR